MNKQLIEKLMKEAGAEDFYGGADCMDTEKFAELIVRECATLARASQYLYANELHDKVILEHFGLSGENK